MCLYSLFYLFINHLRKQLENVKKLDIGQIDILIASNMYSIVHK